MQANQPAKAFTPRHHEAILAIWAAKNFRGFSSDILTKLVKASGVNRRLFAIAATLEAGNVPGQIVNTQA